MADSISAVLAALADPTRRSIVAILDRGDASVGEIADQLPVSRPAVSKHLRVLRSAGLVRDRPVGTRHVFALIASDELRTTRAYLDGLVAAAAPPTRRPPPAPPIERPVDEREAPVGRWTLPAHLS